MLAVGMPAGFPNPRTRITGKQALSKALFSRIDYLGFFLLLCACAFLIVALQQSGIRYAWSNPIPISLLVLSGLLWVAFFAWSYIVSHEGRSQEPVFSWSFLQNRVFLGVLLYVPSFPLSSTSTPTPRANTSECRFTLCPSALCENRSNPATIPDRQFPSPLSSGLRMLSFIPSIPLSTAFASCRRRS